MEKEAREFIENILIAENYYYRNIFIGGASMKRRPLLFVLKINVCKSIMDSEETTFPSQDSKELPGLLSGTIVGLRSKLSNKEIYDNIVRVRDSFLEDRGYKSYREALLKRQCVEVYDTVNEELQTVFNSFISA